MRHRPLLIPILLLASTLSCGGARDWNVLLVTLDTTRADFFSSYGYPLPTTPNFDRLAERGARFDLAIAQASVTPVSHASILTGLNPMHHGVRVMHAASGYSLSPDVPSLAPLLQEHGWRTGAFLSAFPVSDYFGFDHGFDRFDSGVQELGFQRQEAGHDDWNIRANQRRSDVTTDRALAWFETLDPDESWFSWIHYWDPHDGAIFPPHDMMNAFLPPGLAGEDLKRGIYAAELRWVDMQFGRVMRWLEQSGQADRTLIVVVSDHGQGLGDHGWWDHRILYQEQIRVPLFVSLPVGAERHEVPELVRTTDIYPTILQALGLTPPAPVDGAPLQPLMGASPPPDDRIAYADQLNLYDTNATLARQRPLDALLHCAMDSRWKLVHRPLEPEASELFDLRADPGEIRNVLSEQPGEAARLLRWLDAAGGYVDGPFGDQPDPEVLERLKALGYIE